MDVFYFSLRVRRVETASHVVQDFVCQGVLCLSDVDSLWDNDVVRISNCSHDSLAYLMVRMPRSLNLAKTLTKVLYFRTAIAIGAHS